jgi:hypothetical protein
VRRGGTTTSPTTRASSDQADGSPVKHLPDAASLSQRLPLYLALPARVIMI